LGFASAEPLPTFYQEGSHKKVPPVMDAPIVQWPRLKAWRRFADVGVWHKADIVRRQIDVRFRE
jgi:hypothetical protein